VRDTWTCQRDARDHCATEKGAADDVKNAETPNLERDKQMTTKVRYSNSTTYSYSVSKRKYRLREGRKFLDRGMSDSERMSGAFEPKSGTDISMRRGASVVADQKQGFSGEFIFCHYIQRGKEITIYGARCACGGGRKNNSGEKIIREKRE
jgi:hypothetical protein